MPAESKEGATPTPEQLQEDANKFIMDHMWGNDTLHRHDTKPPAPVVPDFPVETEEERARAEEEIKKKRKEKGFDDETETFDPVPDKKEKKETATADPKPDEKKKDEEQKDKDKPAGEKEEKELLGLTGSGGRVAPAVEVKPGKVAPAPAPMDEGDVADRVAARLEPLLKKIDKPDEKKDKEDPFAKFPPEDQAELRVLQHLNKEPRYQGRNLVNEVVRFWDTENQYIRNWVAANPGKPFDDEAEEHVDFYERHEPDISDEERIRASISLDNEPIRTKMADIEKENKELRDKHQQAEQERQYRARMHEVAPLIESQTSGAVLGLSRAIPEFAELVKDAPVMTNDIVSKINQIDPELAEVLNENAMGLKIQVQELEVFRHFGGEMDLNKRVQFRDKDGKPRGPIVTPHADIYEAGIDLENRIMQADPEKRIHEGRHYLPRVEFKARLDAILSGPGTEEEKQARIVHLDQSAWTISADHILDALIKKAAGRVLLERERMHRRMQRLGAPSAKPEAKGDKKDEKKKDDSSPRNSSRTHPPSLGGASDTVDTGKLRNDSPKSHEQILAERW